MSIYQLRAFSSEIERMFDEELLDIRRLDHASIPTLSESGMTGAIQRIVDSESRRA